jgi:hypothetical protein
MALAEEIAAYDTFVQKLWQEADPRQPQHETEARINELTRERFLGILERHNKVPIRHGPFSVEACPPGPQPSSVS